MVNAEPQSFKIINPEGRHGIKWACTRSPLCTRDSIACCMATLHVICGPDAGRQHQTIASQLEGATSHLATHQPIAAEEKGHHIWYQLVQPSLAFNDCVWGGTVSPNGDPP